MLSIRSSQYNRIILAVGCAIALLSLACACVYAQAGGDVQDYALQEAGATATASTEIVGFKRDHIASMAINGETRGDYWASDIIFGTAEGPQWLEVDLGQSREVGQIVLYMVATRHAMLLDDFTLSVEQDGEWVTVAEVEGYQDIVAGGYFYERYSEAAGQSGVYRTEFEPVTTRRVRLDVPTRTARLHEIQVLPPPEPVEPLTGSIRDAGPVLTFDFGTNQSPLADGSQPVTADTLYDEEAGYGWRNAENLFPVDRVAGFDITRDFIAAAHAESLPVSNTFSVDVDNGEYLVGIISGDAAHEVHAFNVTIEDQTFDQPMVTPGAAAACRLNATVVVDDGSLDLTFAGDQAWVVSAVVIGSPGEFDTIDALLSEIEHQFTLGSPGMISDKSEYTPEPPENPAVPTAEERARGYQVFAPDAYMSHVYPTVPPASGERIDRLEAFCTPGEAEPMTFALHALESLRGISVEISDLSGPGNIPSSAVEIRRVQCWPQMFKSTREGEWTVMPELVRELDIPGQMWLRTGRTQQFWLTVRVPEGTQAGQYTGAVEILAGDAGALTLPVNLTVYPFSLEWPRPMHLGIYYYPGRAADPRVNDIESLRDATINELQDLRDHGLNGFALVLQQSLPRISDWPEDATDLDADPVQLDLTYLTFVMDCVEEVGGFEGPFPVYMRSAWLPDHEERERIIQQVVQTVEAERLAQGWPEILYYLWDEPFRDPELAEAEEPYRAVAGIEGIRTYCTVSAEAAERLAPWLDVRCHATAIETRQAAQWPEIQQNAIADGDEYWWYTNSTREYPAVMRFKAGFHFWKSRATGQSYWHYRAPGGSAFCDFDTSRGDHVTSYPGVDGPIPTLQWECHREGIDDAKYAYTLEALIESAEAGDDADLRAAAENARQVLDGIRESTRIQLDWYVEEYGRRGFHWKSHWPHEQYDANRRVIAEQIVALLEAGAEQ